MEEKEPVTKEGLSRECIRLGTAMKKTDHQAREALAALQARVEAVLSTDTLALSLLAKEMEDLGKPSMESMPQG